MLRLVTILGWITGLFLLLILIISAYVYIPVISDPAIHYHERKGTIRSTTINKQWRVQDSLYSEVMITSTSGLQVTLLIRRPTQQPTKSLPVAVLLGGLETGHKGCELIHGIKEIVCVSLSYPGYSPKRYSGEKLLYQIHHLQRAVKDTPPAVGLVTDYLLQQNYTNKQHLEYVGVSLGGFFISVPAVLEPRIARVWIVQSAATPVAIIKHNFLKHVDSDLLGSVISHLIGYAIGVQHIDPAKWVARISPRKVIFVNSKYDEALPLSNVESLHQAALQPKEVIWSEGTHVTSSRKDVIAQLSDIVLSRIAKSGVK